MLSQLTKNISRANIAVDLGTASTRIYNTLHDEVIETPSATNLVSGKSSNEYFQYINDRIATKPLRGGVIVDLRNATNLLKPLVKKSKKLFFSPIALASAPTGATAKERDLLRTALIDAGALHVSIIPEVWAAAIGAGIDMTLPTAQLLVDIGDGITDMAVFRGGDIIYWSSVRIACSDLQRSIRTAVMTKYRMQLYDDSIEKLTHVISSMINEQDDQAETFTLSGIDMFQKKKVDCCINKRDIINSLAPVVDKIIAIIEKTLQQLPEKIFAEIRRTGIHLTGGGACIEGMDRLIAVRTKMAVIISSDPLHSVINGAMQTLNHWNGEKGWWENLVWPRIALASH
ncbi:rod shape-determining protein [Desulfocastanea catecholica]